MQLNRFIFLLASMLLALGCPGLGPTSDQVDPKPKLDNTATTNPQVTYQTQLHADISTYDFRGREELRRQLTSNVYSYFRFTSMRFSEQVCVRFRKEWGSMPTVNLHGDAHVEQYAVTRDGRGLTDFDNAAQGPAILDLVRFITSLRLSEQFRSWNTDEAITAFFAGYRAALDEPNAERPVPAFVNRARQQFSASRQEFLSWADAMMQPFPENMDNRVRDSWQRYEQVIRQRIPDLPPHFFELRRHGILVSGIGSSFYLKFLARFEGPTRNHEDDVILEAKEVKRLPRLSCLHTQLGGGSALRVLVGTARISEMDDPFLAEAPRGPQAVNDPAFWVQRWRARYHELDIETDMSSPDELREVAYDIGYQLGRGHAAGIASPFDAQLRKAQRLMLDKYQDRIRLESNQLAALTISSWTAFRKQLAQAERAQQANRPK